MAYSFIAGRIGSDVDGSGLYVLEGGLTDFGLAMPEVSMVGKHHGGLSAKATQAYKRTDDTKVCFLNKAACWHRTQDAFLMALADMVVGDSLEVVRGAVYSPHREFIRKAVTGASPLWISDVLGVAPTGRVLRVILKQVSTQAKRTMLFVLGVSEGLGGKTWVVSTGGHTAFPASKCVHREGATRDLEYAFNFKNSDRTFLVVTNCVVYMSGPRVRCLDEIFPCLVDFQTSDIALGEQVREYVPTLLDTPSIEALSSFSPFLIKAIAGHMTEGVPTLSGVLFDPSDFIILDDDSDGML